MLDEWPLHRIVGVASALGRVLLGRQVAGRAATIFEDDIFLVSYPRSGNTWIRFLLGNLLHPGDPTTFRNIESRVAEVHFNPNHKLRRLRRPRLLKSHEAFHPAYPRIMYVVRDPRDVAVSYYHHNIKARNIPDDYPIDDFVPRFIRAEFDSWWGSWGDNVMSWLVMRENHRSFLLLRYEDMQEDTRRELLRIASFLAAAGFPAFDISNATLNRAIELSSPSRMRQLEIDQARGYAQLRHTRLDKPFVRTARCGAWKGILSKSSVAAIEAAWAPAMQKLGYKLAETSDDAARQLHPVEV